MATYTKLFRNILQSTIWQESLETKIVWITMLALKDGDGMVMSSLPGLAKSAGVTIEQCKAALEKFKLPDPYSSSKANEGRRIEDVEGGWFILNHFKYLDELCLEDRRAYWAMKQREARARKNNLARKVKKREVDMMRRVGETMETLEAVPETPAPV
jgi:hypothetical protein